MKRLVVFLAACCLAGASYAADYGYLNGCVVDGSTGSPVSGAMITIAEPGFNSVTNYSDDNGCTVANTGNHIPQPHIQVDVLAGPGFMPWFGYASPVCTSYPVSPPYIVCEFVIELVPRLAVSGQIVVNFRSASAPAYR